MAETSLVVFCAKILNLQPSNYDKYLLIDSFSNTTNNEIS